MAEKKKFGFWKIVLIVIGVFILISVIANLSDDSEPAATTQEETTTEAAGSAPEKAEEALPGVGVPVKAGYFEVRVNNASIEEWVNTGNQFTDLEREAGIKYLIINVTFKNVDKKNRMMFDGELYINHAGKNYNFDAETILADGWGILLDTINPLTFKTTNLVYKIPQEVMGPITWKPTGSRETIYVGDIE